ncbi:MAG TPA: GNAT family N-acetyltransferase [Rhodospirillaceae bacterium]|nr:GNAT family N-acetyltransferase [Magnetovibrio sp.]HBT44127.1 GNAT family N-acetyltransferase [Rhodospirillaceae bacterium]HCS72096.1 GNAT family N-acetyltransferase [Rhodospirillaceae bacterium]|tara:strand:- start:13186 stop:14355 length:1170 start_codon:yes stop_codon:yes gene_type:complete
MPDGRDAVAIKIIKSLSEVSPEAWDACAGTDNPFVRHAFLSALEDSGSATGETGWLGQHLVIEDPAGGIAACAPLYLKNHSYGEYVFDWGWADAYERAGRRYYPKLQCAVPFTPVTGPRLLVNQALPDGQRREMRLALIAGMAQLAQNLSVSSLHVTFPTEDEWEAFGSAGYLQRIGQQFHWENKGFKTFDDFLGELSSRKRKNIKKERRAVHDAGLDIRVLEGAGITEAHWDAFFQFYMDTTDKKWGQAYLTRRFFSLLGERLDRAVVLIVVEKDGRPVAGALNLRGGDTLYGRNWGCVADYKFLHFEACYYQAIDYAIAHGLKWVEAGAQGPHKVQRGYLPRRTFSAHWIADKGFRDAVSGFLNDESRGIEREMSAYGAFSPFKKSE